LSTLTISAENLLADIALTSISSETSVLYHDKREDDDGCGSEANAHEEEYKAEEDEVEEDHDKSIADK
jgi:hypothetical protein